MNIRSIMKQIVQTVGPNQSIQEANELMRAGQFRHLPVLAGTNVVGMLSERDVAMASNFVSKDDQALHNVRTTRTVEVREVMSPEPIVLQPSDSLNHALQTAVHKKLGAYPVMEHGQLIGIVTTTDLMQAALDQLSAPTP